MRRQMRIGTVSEDLVTSLGINAKNKKRVLEILKGYHKKEQDVSSVFVNIWNNKDLTDKEAMLATFLFGRAVEHEIQKEVLGVINSGLDETIKLVDNLVKSQKKKVSKRRWPWSR